MTAASSSTSINEIQVAFPINKVNTKQANRSKPYTNTFLSIYRLCPSKLDLFYFSFWCQEWRYFNSLSLSLE
jgi:hypothetical protein